jgi:isopentenyldiphosphate isomerase
MENYIHKKLDHLVILEDAEGLHRITAFSKWPCHCCGSPLAGERYEVKAVRRSNKAIGATAVMRPVFSVCPDCVVRWQ